MILCAVMSSLSLSLRSCNIIWFHPNQLLLGHSRDTVINEVIIHALVGLVDEEKGCLVLWWQHILKDELVDLICLYLSCTHLLTCCSFHIKNELLTFTDTANLQSFPLLKSAISCVESISPLFPSRKKERKLTFNLRVQNIKWISMQFRELALGAAVIR